MADFLWNSECYQAFHGVHQGVFVFAWERALYQIPLQMLKLQKIQIPAKVTEICDFKMHNK